MLIGRFAPSPTGPLHMGSLITALASYLDIKSRGGSYGGSKGGKWYVRIDNIDPPREVSGATERILASLQAHGLYGDLPVDYQSTHQQRYAAALDKLEPHVFYCTCSRKAVSRHRIYPGTCRDNTTPRPDAAIRVRTADASITVQDQVAGDLKFDLANDYGDFIVKRRDGLWSYILAAAVDDAMDASHILRGQDLLAVTPQQIYLMQHLELKPPQYAHIPVLCYADGTKLSKQTHAPALDDSRAPANLHDALHYLGMNPPEAPNWSSAQWLSWAQQHWNLQRLPVQLAPFRSPL